MQQLARLLIIAHVLTSATTGFATESVYESPVTLETVFRTNDDPFCRFETDLEPYVDTDSSVVEVDASRLDTPLYAVRSPQFLNREDAEWHGEDLRRIVREPIQTNFIDVTEPIVIRAQNGSMFGAGTRLRFDYSEDYGDEVRIHGQLMTQLTGQFGLDAEATWYDKTRNSDITEELWTGDANIVYKMDVSRIALRFGGGAAYALRDGSADVGYNFTYGTDFYIRRPFLVSGEIDWGQISSDQLFHWRVTVGFVYGSLEIFGGYDSYELGEFEVDGPVAGLGIVF